MKQAVRDFMDGRGVTEKVKLVHNHIDSDIIKSAFLPNASRRKYPARTSVIFAGDKPESIYYVISGSLSAIMDEDEAGREIILSYINKGEFFGEMGLFVKPDDRPSESGRSAWIQTRTPCEVAEMSYAKFKSLSNEHPQLIFEVAAQMAKRLRKTSEKVGDLTFMDVEGRIARTLVELCRLPDAVTHPEGMQIRVTRQELSRIVGCSREMAGRVLKDLKDKGLIDSHGKTIVVYGTR